MITFNLSPWARLSAAATFLLANFAVAGTPLLKEDFETEKRGGLYSALVSHNLLQIAEGEGVNGGNALKATYEGYERGSHRIVVRVPLSEQANEVTLSYDVRFDDGFDFVRGGKLHGVGPVAPVTGGNPLTPEGWSARVNFGREGEIRTYHYVQNHPRRYGQGFPSPDHKFTVNGYQAVSLHVKLNDPDESNGFANIYLNGELAVEHTNIQFRATDDPKSLISQFLFSTFHGGSSPDWAPKTPDGEYATHYAWFDNFVVYRGKNIRQEPGACWQDSE